MQCLQEERVTKKYALTLQQHEGKRRVGRKLGHRHATGCSIVIMPSMQDVPLRGHLANLHVSCRACWPRSTQSSCSAKASRYGMMRCIQSDSKQPASQGAPHLEQLEQRLCQGRQIPGQE